MSHRLIALNLNSTPTWIQSIMISASFGHSMTRRAKAVAITGETRSTLMAQSQLSRPKPFRIH